jgi:uncharacterized membrane protein (UPF0127 family)
MVAIMEKETLQIEIADTPSKRERGLMWRKSLGENEGMLFKFNNPQRLSFWMANTYIPLDIAFLDDYGKIFQIEKLDPMSTYSVSSSKPCKYALEVNKDWFKKRNFSIGTKIISDIKKLSFRQEKKMVLSQNAPATPPDALMPNLNTPLVEETPTPTQQPPQGLPDETETQQKPQEVKPEIKVDLTMEEKLKDAAARGKKLEIIYINDKGHTMIRTLQPVDYAGRKGYPVESGPNGKRFDGQDISPRVEFGGEGGKTYVVAPGYKSWLFNKIKKLEIKEI